MKKILFLLCFTLVSCSIQLYSQPTREIADVIEGSRVSFNKILYGTNNDRLYLAKWTAGEYHPNNRLYILKEQKDNINKDELLNTFFVKKSELDDTYKILELVYEDKIMIIKILKNKPKLRITINNLHFKEGIFRIDLNQLYEQHKTNNIKIESFPTEEDLDFSGDRIVDIWNY